MEIDLPYGDSFLKLDIPDNQVGVKLEAKPLPNPESEARVVEEALNKPIDSAPLGEIVKKGDRVCIIVGDVTRYLQNHL